jgi:DKNYY family
MTPLKKIGACLLVWTLASCSTGYHKDSKLVYYSHWNEAVGGIEDTLLANPATFKVLRFDDYAKDDKLVFYKGEIIAGADAPTFEAIEGFFARDKNRGYYGNEPVKESDGKAFTVINSYYSRDGKDIYYRTDPLHSVNPKGFKFVYENDLGDSWTTDGRYYYFEQYKIPSEDYANLKIYENSGGLSKDKHWVYFLDHRLNFDIDGKKVVDSIDVASFIATGFLECRDKYGCFNVYHGRENCKN